MHGIFFKIKINSGVLGLVGLVNYIDIFNKKEILKYIKMKFPTLKLQAKGHLYEYLTLSYREVGAYA